MHELIATAPPPHQDEPANVVKKGNVVVRSESVAHEQPAQGVMTQDSPAATPQPGSQSEDQREVETVVQAQDQRHILLSRGVPADQLWIGPPINPPSRPPARAPSSPPTIPPTRALRFDVCIPLPGAAGVTLSCGCSPLTGPKTSPVTSAPSMPKPSGPAIRIVISTSTPKWPTSAM